MLSARLTRVRTRQLTSINRLLDNLRKGTFHGLFGGLVRQMLADISYTEAVDGFLERVALPAKDVVAVLRVSIPFHH